MKEKEKKRKIGSGAALIISIMFTFFVLGAVVYAVSTKISAEMSASAVSNLTESLDLLKGTIEAILKKEAEFQKLVAREIAEIEDPESFVRSYHSSGSMVKISLIKPGEKTGISNTGEEFSEEELDFSAQKTVDGLPVSGSYVNGMGTWAYTMKCPVVRGQTEIGTLYIE